ncbi:MAG: division/cell wall cluster transcriptional repressor MraZ [Elusimicrobiota bacterium]
MLRGRYITRLDKQCRVRLPASLRKSIEDKYGREVFITSLDGEHVQIFPVQEWKKMTSIEDEGAFKNPLVRTFALRINRMGVRREMDRWGRILIHKELRNKVNLKGKIIVVGAKNNLKLSKKLSE